MQRARELLADAVRAIYPDDVATRYVITQIECGQLDMIGIHAALQAITAALRAAPEGFVMVPVEPTEFMLWAANQVDDDAFSHGAMHGADSASIYRAMLAARPQEASDATK